MRDRFEMDRCCEYIVLIRFLIDVVVGCFMEYKSSWSEVNGDVCGVILLMWIVLGVSGGFWWYWVYILRLG